jgi:O-antigen/teichoic acid export membrane protein
VKEGFPFMFSSVFRIGKNSVLITISRVTEMVSSLVMTGMLSRYLGVETFGDYLFIMAIVLTVTSFAHMGLPHLLMREISQHKSSTANYIQSGLMLTGIALLGAGLVILAIGLFFRFSFLYMVAAFLGFFSEALIQFSGPFVSTFISFEKMEYDAIATMINRFLLIGLLIAVVSFDLGFISIFLAVIIANLVRFLTILYISNRNLVPLHFSLKGNRVRYLFKETLPLGVSFVLTQFYLNINLFILKAIGEGKDVSLFQAPFSIVLRLQVLPLILLTAFASIMARSAVRDLSYTHLRNIYMGIAKYLFIACLPFSLAGVLLSERITILIFGIDFTPAAISFQILIWIIGFHFINIFSEHVLTVIGKQKLFMISNISAFLINIFLTLILGYHYGYIGASIAALGSFILLSGSNFYFVSRFVKRISLSFTLKPLMILSVLGLFLYHFRNWNSQDLRCIYWSQR